MLIIGPIEFNLSLHLDGIFNDLINNLNWPIRPTLKGVAEARNEPSDCTPG